MRRATALFGSLFTVNISDNAGRGGRKSSGGKALDTVTGYVDHIIYQNKENGYAVLSLAVEGW